MSIVTLRNKTGTVGDDGFRRNGDSASNGGRTEQPSAGIVHDLGNLIQIASSALNRVARDPSVSTAPALESVVASARTALQSAGALVRHALGRALEPPREIEHADLSVCLAEVETLIRSAELHVRLEVRVGSDLPAANCDRLGLQNISYSTRATRCPTAARSP
ncbi:hypothetical protein MESS4_790058 [Mesorhizobium sp. STM 4661]|nr:hypothetical protein MESS4_790058 [Mesorhizobium sp. STM 4661]